MRGAPRHPDRRTFLRAAGIGALSISGAWGLGCAGEDAGSPEDATSGGDEARSGSRPIVLPWGTDAVLVAAPAVALPAAYVSRATQRVYVDHDLRDRVAVALAAHISVSTGLWRIPLPGDPPRAPIQPGDALREFEERPMRDWDPGGVAAEGDARLIVGREEETTLALTCDAVAGSDRWCSGGPWRVRRGLPGVGDLVREVLAEVGRARTWDDRRCGGTPVEVRCVTWRAPEA